MGLTGFFKMNTSRFQGNYTWTDETSKNYNHRAWKKHYKLEIKIIVSLIESMLCFIGITANIIALKSLLQKSKTIKRRKPSFNGTPTRNISSTLIYNLIIANLLALTVSYPLLITETFTMPFTNDLSCKLIRFINVTLPCVANTNIFLIAVERYLSTFYPHKVPSRRHVRTLVMAAWAISGLRGFVWTFALKFQQYSIDSRVSTVGCRINTNSVFHKVWMVVDGVTFFIIQTVTCFIIGSRINWFMRKRKWPKSRRLGNIAQFSQIILVSTIPYCVMLVFIIVNLSLLRENLDLQILFILRRCFAIFPSYANTIVVPMMMILKRKPKLNNRTLLNNSMLKNKKTKQGPFLYETGL